MLQVILLSTAAASWLSIVYQIDHRSSKSDFDVLYDKPWVRISPYLVGLAGGWVEWLGGNPPKQARVDQEAADSPGNAISRRSLALLDHHHLIFIVILIYMN